MLHTIVDFSCKPARDASACLFHGAGYRIFTQQTKLLPHAHREFYELLFVQSGQGRIEIDGQVYIANKGDLVVYPPGVSHLEDWRGTQDLPLVFYCQQERIFSLPDEQALDAYIRRRPVLPTGEYAQHIARLWWLLDLECRDRSAYSDDIIQCLTSSLMIFTRRLISLLDTQIVEPAAQSIAQGAKRFIDTHYAEKLTLCSIAEALHVSAFHLSHEFKREIGQAPISYLNGLRMQHAQLLLKTTAYPVQEIVFLVGFDNIPNFNKLFKRHTGFTPSQYRKLYLDSLNAHAEGEK